MDIHSLAVGGGFVPSVIVLRPQAREGVEAVQLPIRIGPVEASAIAAGIGEKSHTRPLTHDLLDSVITSLGGELKSVSIVDVDGTTFFAELTLLTESNRTIRVDSRPSDAIALAVRTGAPIYADERVLDAAALPDFLGIELAEQDREMERFHDFVEGLSPADFME